MAPHLVSLQYWPGLLGHEPTIELPEITTTSVIGVAVAIAGNVLISLALNCQKLAHKRLEAERLRDSQNGTRNSPRATDPRSRQDDSERIHINELQSVSEVEAESSQENLAASERAPLVPTSNRSPVKNYGSRSAENIRLLQQKKPRTFASRFNPFRTNTKRTIVAAIEELRGTSDGTGTARPTVALPVDIITEQDAVNSLKNRVKKPENGKDIGEISNEGDYLKSKLWWLGFVLMNVGELGNFISYAFAPASVVAPLGTFALMANCVFAPLMLSERFRKRDLFGILIAIIGVVTVVLSSNTSDVRLDPAGLLRAISQHAFIMYACVYVVGAIILAGLSEGTYGRRYVFVDVGLCALFGGFTVLSTKGVSTLLTMEWIEMFMEWITYPVIAVLIVTGVGQIRYLNRALMRFDSKVVIPIQFVLFTLSAIIGSAILYGDFKKATFHQLVTFLYGCAATFAGVFIIAWAPNSSSSPADYEYEYDTEADGEESDAPITSPTSDDSTRGGTSPKMGMGTLGRRNRAALMLPNGAFEPPALQHKPSSVSLIGLSPAQGLLLVHTPPRDDLVHRAVMHNAAVAGQDDPEAGAGSSSPVFQRKRAISWFGEERGGSGHGSRSESAGRRARAMTGVGSGVDGHTGQ